MQNLIIKPATLAPSTYSQIGNTLLPSKDCNNRKIARKFTQRGPRLKKDIYGSTTIDKPFISTFKRFDRPSPLISRNCQNCKIVSVPSVTDKTIYPCSLGKYGVTEYSNGINKINNLGNSLYHRITTSNNQLYQQYRVTNKNNIEPLEKCCDFILETGIYNNGIINIAVFMDGCTILCIDNNPVTQISVEDPCEYIIDGTDIIVEIISDNSITIDSIEYTLLPFESTTVADFGPEDNNGKLIPSGIDCNLGDLIITDIQITNNNLSIKENGVTINIGNKYQEYTDPSSSEVFRFYQNKSAIYVFNENPSNYIIDKITCGCNYELCCKFTLLQDGIYTTSNAPSQLPTSLIVFSQDCDSICISIIGTANKNLENPCIYDFDTGSISGSITLTTNNSFELTIIGFNTYSYTFSSSQQTSTDDENVLGDFDLNGSPSSTCDDITITDVKFDNGILTFNEVGNSNTITLGPEYYEVGADLWGYIQNGRYYVFFSPDSNINAGNPLLIADCECTFKLTA